LTHGKKQDNEKTAVEMVTLQQRLESLYKDIGFKLGREVNEKRNTPLFYIYNDGTVEKKIVIE
jgi:hypothetical protein